MKIHPAAPFLAIFFFIFCPSVYMCLHAQKARDQALARWITNQSITNSQIMEDPEQPAVPVVPVGRYSHVFLISGTKDNTPISYWVVDAPNGCFIYDGASQSVRLCMHYKDITDMGTTATPSPNNQIDL